MGSDAASSLSFDVRDCIRFWARYRGSHPALSSNGRVLTYSELAQRVPCLSPDGAFGSSERRVAVLSERKLDTAESVLRVVASGCSAVILNPHLPPDQLARSISDAEPAYRLVAEPQVRLWRDVCAVAPGLDLVREFPCWTTQGSAAAAEARYEPSPRDEWAVLYSSGSTGVPKGIERDAESMQTEFLGWCLELGLGRGTKFYIGRPVYYTGGLVLTMSTLLAGGHAVLNEVGEASQDLIADLEAESTESPIDWAFFVPDQIRSLMRAERTAELQGRIRGILTMGAPIAGWEKQRLAELLCCRVIESWGNSESLGTITDEDMLWDCPDSIGRPFLGDEMCIVDSKCRPVGHNQLGLIAGGEAAGFTRYTGRPEETSWAKREGLVVSEDLGWQDERGRFFLAGRMQERVVISGREFFLSSLESKLREGGLADVTFCLGARATGDGSEIGLLWEARDACGKAVIKTIESAGPDCPVQVAKSCERLPRTASGKVDRNEACRLLWDDQR